MAHFDRAELSASKIQTQLLEKRSVTTWEEFVEYMSDLWETMQNISQCAKKVKEVHRSTLLAIESERQRQLSEGIKEVCEIHETVICSPAAARLTTRPATRRLGLAAARNTSYKISITSSSFATCPTRCIYGVTKNLCTIVSGVHLWSVCKSFSWGIDWDRIEPPVTTPKDFNTWVRGDHQESTNSATTTTFRGWLDSLSQGLAMCIRLSFGAYLGLVLGCTDSVLYPMPVSRRLPLRAETGCGNEAARLQVVLHLKSDRPLWAAVGGAERSEGVEIPSVSAGLPMNREGGVARALTRSAEKKTSRHPSAHPEYSAMLPGHMLSICICAAEGYARAVHDHREPEIATRFPNTGGDLNRIRPKQEVKL
ncbi:hypothetical protein DFH08DRAFT_797194 [Mycena albidolilacea]|uniref:Uncharacterized protein n=1 Tax=Mycena albidolilacea TaxID=1033008 RepID=A0AAD7AQK6_9AGAR|nr:hypothetical protein DFH08DRAFT_797194 [Mycena albidolilacea]